MAHLNEAPKTSASHLADIVEWLRLGDHVVVHNAFKHGRYFHSKCFSSKEPVELALANHRNIYVDVSAMPALLNQGEWDDEIRGAGHQECQCELKARLSDPNIVPNRHMFTLKF